MLAFFSSLSPLPQRIYQLTKKKNLGDGNFITEGNAFSFNEQL